MNKRGYNNHAGYNRNIIKDNLPKYELARFITLSSLMPNKYFKLN